MDVRRSFYNVDHNVIDYDHNKGNGFEKSGFDITLNEKLSQHESEIFSEILVRNFYNGYFFYDFDNEEFDYHVFVVCFKMLNKR